MTKSEVIDSHHHLWRYSPDGYPWIGDSMQRIKRDFMVADLTAAMAAAGVDGAVTVQAQQTLAETQWLLDLADRCSAILGVVGWAPFADEDFPRALEQFAGPAKLKGLRHIVHDEPDDNFILRADFNRGIRALEDMGLVYDILIFERHLPQAIEFVDRHPNQVFVLDHIAKPRIAAGELEPWATRIRELARRQNVWCKVSGMVTEAKWEAWSADTLRPYLDTVANAFGPARLMAGSDWPVCLVACEYKGWWDLLRGYFAGFSEGERSAIFGGTATAVYRL